MKRIISLPAIATAAALFIGLVPAVPAQAATIKKRTVKVDVDGDGRNDTVTITYRGGERFRISVKTAKKRTSSVSLNSSSVYSEQDPWWGAAKLDKVKGHELLLLRGGGSDGYTIYVATWRKNRLVWQEAPKQAGRDRFEWTPYRTENQRGGYRLSTSKGKRFVKAATLTRSGNRWTGKIVTHQWKSGKWKKVSTTKVRLTESQAARYDNIQGVKIIRRPW